MEIEKLIKLSNRFKDALIKLDLPNIPFEFDYSKEYCGKIIKHNNTFKIRVSIPRNTSIKRLAETIAHEYAHITHWEHNELHHKLTQEYIKILT